MLLIDLQAVNHDLAAQKAKKTMVGALRGYLQFSAKA